MSFWGWVKKKMDGRIIPIFFMGFRWTGYERPCETGYKVKEVPQNTRKTSKKARFLKSNRKTEG